MDEAVVFTPSAGAGEGDAAADAEAEAVAALCAQVLAYGERGWERARIREALGWSEEELKAREAASPDFAYAMEFADTKAQAWFDWQVREALEERFDVRLWRAFMRYRFGEDPLAPLPRPQKPKRRKWWPGVGYV